MAETPEYRDRKKHSPVARDTPNRYPSPVPDESLLTPEVRALIGRTTPMGTVEITLRAVRRSLEVYVGAAEAEQRTTNLAPGDAVPGYVIEALGSDFNVESDGNGLPSVLPNSLLDQQRVAVRTPAPTRRAPDRRVAPCRHLRAVRRQVRLQPRLSHRSPVRRAQMARSWPATSAR